MSNDKSSNKEKAITFNLPVTRSFRLTPKEEKLFNDSKSQEIRFSIVGGIGIGVSYLNDKGIWIDITDYDYW